MKNLLIVFILAAVAGTGYEVYQHIQDCDAYTKQRADLNYHIDDLKRQNKELADEQVALTQKLTSLQKQAATLQSQVDSSEKKPAAPAVAIPPQ